MNNFYLYSSWNYYSKVLVAKNILLVVVIINGYQLRFQKINDY